MIKVDRSFYESGCTMEGKGNRVILKEKDSESTLEMTFFGDEVTVTSEWGLLKTVVPFKNIEKIQVIEEELTGRPILSIKLKD